MYASKNGYTDIVKLLIDVGANVNAQDDEGYTALRLASKAGHTEIVQMLREAGAE
jgi:ankyrin repeat protein